MIYMNKLILIAIFICPLTLAAQIGDPFPAMEGENLKNESVQLPEDIRGKHTLIGLAFSKKSEKALNSWFTPVYDQLIKEPEEGSLFAFSYDVNVYFVPMLTGAKRPAYKAVMKKVEEDVNPSLHPNVLFYKGTLNEYKSALGIKDKNVPYFYLLDKEGKIIYATTGTYNRAKLQKIIDELPFE